MFGHLSSERFEKGKESAVGPGSYDLPSTLDERAAAMEGPDRWTENNMDAASPEIDETKQEEKLSEVQVLTSRKCDEKENRAPSSHRRKSCGVRNQSPKTANLETASEIKERHQVQKVTSQLEMAREDFKQKTRELKEMQQLLAAKDRKLEDQQRKLEQLDADRREAHRRTAEAEADRDSKRKLLREKDLEITNMKRKDERLRLAAEEKNRQQDKQEAEHRHAFLEIQKLKANVEVLQSKLDSSERDRKVLDSRVHMQEDQKEEIQKNCKEQVRRLQDILNREEERRRDLERQVARADVQAEHGGTELAHQKKQNDELQRRVVELEAELKVQLDAQLERSKEQQNLETELAGLKARISVQNDKIKRAEDQRQELEARVVKAEVAEEACTRELFAERSRAAEREEERQKAGETRCAELSSRAEDAEVRLRTIEQDLEEERSKLEELERRAIRSEHESVAYQRRVAELEGALQNAAPELIARLERAEQEASDAVEEVRRWKEWADEQSLRELTAETQRLEELRRVREDVNRQVAEARHEVVKENKALQLRIQDFENGNSSEAAKHHEQKFKEQEKTLEQVETERSDLEVQLERLQTEMDTLRSSSSVEAQRFDEQRRALEAKVARAEAGAVVAADELLEEREKFEAQLKSLKIEHETALAVHREEVDTSLCAERDAKSRQETLLQSALHESRTLTLQLRWYLLVSRSLHQDLQIKMYATVEPVCTAAYQWRSRALGHQSNEQKLMQQDTELNRLGEECDKIAGEKHELVLSLQQLQQELQIALAETKRLRERESAYEEDVLRISERSAELGGHANPKQKIKHLLSVKEENQALRQDLKRARQHAAQVEAQLRVAHFLDPAASEPGSARGRTSCHKPPPLQPSTPGRTTPTPKVSRDRIMTASPDSRADVSQRDRAEAARAVRMHQRAAERAAAEYQHLALLVERALLANSEGGHSLACSPAEGRSAPLSGAATPEPRSAEHLNGTALAEPCVLFRKLRDLAGGMSVAGGSNQHQFKNQDPDSNITTPQPKSSPTAPSPEPEDEESLTPPNTQHGHNEPSLSVEPACEEP